MANGTGNPFLSGALAGEQIVGAPFAAHQRRQQLKAEQNLAIKNMALKQAAAEQNDKYINARINYLNALAQGKGIGSAITPAVPTMQTGVPPTPPPSQSIQSIGQSPSAGAPTSAPATSVPVAPVEPSSSTASSPTDVSPAAPYGIAAPPTPNRPAAAATPAGTPVSSSMTTLGGGGTAANQVLNQMAPGIFINPITVGRYTRRGASVSVQDPATTQVYSGSAPTMTTQTFQQGKGAGVAELENVSPIITQAFNDYGGNPIQSHAKLAKDMAEAAAGNQDAENRLINLAIANRLRPDMGAVLGRALTGGVPQLMTMAHMIHSQYAGLPSTLTWMPESVQQKSSQLYQHLIKRMSEAGQRRVMTGSYVTIPSTTKIVGGIPRPAFQDEQISEPHIHMRAPNGKIYLVPANKADAYRKIGGEVINAN